MTQIDRPGIYNIPSKEYHADPTPVPCLSRSVIKDLIFESPAKAKWNHPRLNANFKPDYGAGKFDLGSAAHDLLLQGLEIAVIADGYDDWRKKEAQEIRKMAWQDGKVPLLREQFERAKIMAGVAEQAIHNCTELGISNLRTDGDAELSYIWVENGLWMKIRTDWIKKDRTLILDYKTTGVSVNPYDLGRLVATLHYDIQDVFYRRGVKAIEDMDPRFVFLFQETEEPYFCSIIELPDHVKTVGEQKVMNGIFLWKECMASENWWGYPNKVVNVNYPRWAITDWEQRCLKIGTEID